MIKKIICVLSIFFVMFGITGCGLENELLDYKAEAKIGLEAYAESKGKDNYSAENWLVVEKAVEDGKAAVDAAADEEGVDMAVAVAKCEIDEIETRDSDLIQNGAYSALENTGDYVLIRDNLITLSLVIPDSQISSANIVSDTFEFILVNGVYIGNNVRKAISFKLLNNELLVEVKRNGAIVNKASYRKNVDIELSSENSIRLDAPRDISINNTGLRWSPTEFMCQTDTISVLLNRAGILGVGVEVKQTGKKEFELIEIRDFYPNPDCFFDVYFPDLNLTRGTNIVKIAYLGGLFLHDNMIKVSENSEAVYFSVIVDELGDFITERI